MPARRRSASSGPRRVRAATSTRNRSRGSPSASSTICFSAPERSRVGITCKTFSTRTLPGGGVSSAREILSSGTLAFDQAPEEFHMPARHGGDGVALDDPPPGGGGHLGRAIGGRPLLEDGLGERVGIAGGGEPAVLLIRDQRTIARDRGGDQRDPQRHRFEQG